MSSNSTLPETVQSPYGYVPTEAVCIVFIALFAISGVLHLGEAIKWRTWWMIPTMVLANVGEVIGWSGRLWSSRNPPLLDPFLMQISSTIISPSFMSAANFTILGLIIKKVGSQYSWLTPRWYLIIFVTFDVVSLVVQAIGGAKASGLASRHEDADPGAKIMLYGIIAQMIAIVIYSLLGAEFITRFILNKPVRAIPAKDGSFESFDEKANGRSALDKGTKLMLIGLVINTVFMLVRSSYRTAELLDGWSGSIITNQALFNWLDGMPITVCTYTFNVLHPGYLLLKASKLDNYSA